jgi:hypothetical protein|tara:strand:- start:1853 stop:2608 length:756 start_codon:yes stop_codon:yes gene_type:complete
MKKTFYIMLGLLAIGFTSCTEDDVVDPIVEVNSASIDFSVNHRVGTQIFTAGTAYSVGVNENATFSRYAYLLGSFYLMAEDGSKVIIDSQYAHIEAHSGKTTFSLVDIPYGTYKSIGFSIGLDSAVNHGNPNQYNSDHPLSAINNSLHWGWVGGYIFTAIEGKDVDADESIIFHLAGSNNKVDFELPTNFTHGAAGSSVALGYDIAEVFINPNSYSFTLDGRSTHSVSDPVTTKLIENMADVFTLTSAASK